MKTIIIYINYYDYLNIIHEVAKLSAVTGFPSRWLQGLELHATHRDTEKESTFLDSNPLFKIQQHFTLFGIRRMLFLYSCAFWLSLFSLVEEIYWPSTFTIFSFLFNVLLSIQYLRNLCFLILIWTTNLLYIKIFLETLVAFLFYNASRSFCF